MQRWSVCCPRPPQAPIRLRLSLFAFSLNPHPLAEHAQRHGAQRHAVAALVLVCEQLHWLNLEHSRTPMQQTTMHLPDGGPPYCQWPDTYDGRRLDYPRKPLLQSLADRARLLPPAHSHTWLPPLPPKRHFRSLRAWLVAISPPVGHILDTLLFVFF